MSTHLRSSVAPPDLAPAYTVALGQHSIRTAQRQRARAFVRQRKSNSYRPLRLIAEAVRQTATTALVGDAGSRRKNFTWEMTPHESRALFSGAEKAGLCETQATDKTATITFRCLEDLLAVFDKDAAFFMKFG